jgi:DNA-directed RNA polymerase subunit RPC12/RpoP
MRDMDKVRFACPRCQTLMQTGSEKVGYDVACPHCAHRFRLVESGNSPAGDSSAGERSSADDVTLAPTATPRQNTEPSTSFGQPSSQPQASYLTPLPKTNPYATVQPSYPSGHSSAGFCCPYCQTNRPPVWKSEVSQIGWIVFAILLVTTCFLCFVGFFIRDKYRVCSQCNIRLS